MNDERVQRERSVRSARRCPFIPPKYQAMMNNRTNYGLREAGMAQMDDSVGALLKHVEDIGEADNTIVVFTTDNGAEVFTWPDGGMTPFKATKGTVYEGASKALRSAAGQVDCSRPDATKPGTSVERTLALSGLRTSSFSSTSNLSVAQRKDHYGHAERRQSPPRPIRTDTLAAWSVLERLCPGLCEWLLCSRVLAFRRGAAESLRVG